MNRIICLLLLIALTVSLFSCASNENPDTKLSDEEQMLFDALLVASNSFFNPSEMRVIGVGDSWYTSWDGIYYKYLTVRIQGENKFGGISSDYYRLYLYTLEGKALATALAEDIVTIEWEYCKNTDYPKNTFPSYDEYLNFYLSKYFFHSELDRTNAAEHQAKLDWDNSKSDEYPRSDYETYDEYLEFVYWYYEINYHVVKNYDKEISPSIDIYFGKCTVLEDSSIEISEEDIYDVSKINKALKNYWAEKLGNT